MKKVFIILLPALFLFNGCIEIVEEITINADQSGTVSIYMDLGTYGGLLTSLGEKCLSSDMLDQLKKMPETTAGILKDIKGVSNIIPVTNKKGLYSISFDFRNSKQLNAALYKLFGVKKKFFEPNFVMIRKHTLKKKNYAPVLRLFVKKYQDQLKDNGLLKVIDYKSISHFSKEVKKYSNKKSTLSVDKKTLMFKCTIEELIAPGSNIGNKVKY
jgi:hypothetical protein